MSSSPSTAALADLGQSGRADQREAFGDHARARSGNSRSSRSARADSRFPPPARARADVSTVSPASSSPTSPAGSSRQRRPSGTRYCSTRMHIAVIDRQDHRGLDVARAGDIFPFALLLRDDEAAFPDHVLGSSRIVAHSSISRSGSSLRSSSVLGKCSERIVPICATAAAIPSPGRPSRTSSTSAAIASPQRFGGDRLVDRLVGDDLGHALVERQIEQDAHPRRSAAFGADLEILHRAPPYAARARGAGRQGEPKRRPGQGIADDQEDDRLGDHQREEAASQIGSPAQPFGNQPSLAVERVGVERQQRRDQQHRRQTHNAARHRDNRRTARRRS